MKQKLSRDFCNVHDTTVHSQGVEHVRDQSLLTGKVFQQSQLTTNWPIGQSVPDQCMGFSEVHGAAGYYMERSR